jgi:hydroxypyruvate reductase
MTVELRQPLARVLHAALRAVDPAEAVRRCVALAGETLTIGGGVYRLAEIDRIVVVGAGKAGAPMSAALHALLGARISAGIVTVKHGHTDLHAEATVRLGSLRGSGLDQAVSDPTRASRLRPIELVEAGHPTPDPAGMAGAAWIADLLGTLGERDLVIVVLSGGGSALLPLPVNGLTLEDHRALTNLLLWSGADITEINTVRKHCSRLQGGQMARLAAPARVATLILSDVVGSPLDVIASGPTVADPTTYADALTILRRYEIEDRTPPAVTAHLRRGVAGEIAETPKPGDPVFERVNNVIIGDNASACRAAAAEARALGFHDVFLTTYCQGEAREVGKMLAGLALGVANGQSEWQKPACLVLGGETTVTVRGDGVGGRNQELALAAALALDSGNVPAGTAVVVASLATDGTDGPTVAAGGIALPDSVARGRALGLDAHAALSANDSLPYLDAVGNLIVTGPTGTNVNDLMLVMVG